MASPPLSEEENQRYCHHCNGSGEGLADGTRCSTCRGSGVMKHAHDDDEENLGNDGYDNHIELVREART